ncbi:MAG: hypothetical protein AAGD38_18895 [Acidobacteriota bacterium]
MKARYLLALSLFPGLLSAQCNVAPVAADDIAIHRGAVVLVDVLANDSDGDGQALSVFYDRRNNVRVVVNRVGRVVTVE